MEEKSNLRDIKKKKMDIENIKKKIDELIKQQKIKGEFNKILTQKELHNFEEKHEVELPVGYYEFLSQIGNGGPGPNYGLLSLQESMVDFKLDQKPRIDISSNFKYNKMWNEAWINSFDWENERPELDVVNKYMDVSHISGCLQISHYGHGCTNLLILKGESKGQIWFDGRADYGGLIPEENKQGKVCNFLEWYCNWLDELMFNL